MPLTRRQTRMFDFDVREIGDGELSHTAAMEQALALSTIRLDARIGQLSRAPSLSLSPETGVAAAMAAMRRRGARAAVVVQNHRPLGVITDHDAPRVALADGLRARPVPGRAGHHGPFDLVARPDDSDFGGCRVRRRGWGEELATRRGGRPGAARGPQCTISGRSDGAVDPGPVHLWAVLRDNRGDIHSC